MESEQKVGFPLALERFRAYLHLLARMQLRGDQRQKIEASDIVQQALLRAHSKQDQFNGTTDNELIAWLRRILATTLSDAFKAHNRDCRDAKREVSIEADVAASSVRLEALLAADQSSPSMRADNADRLLRLAEALAELSERQREAIVLRYCHGWTMERIGQHMNCSAPAIVGLIKRGSNELRERMGGL